MRKLVCLLAVAMFAAPAFGGDITFTATDNNDGSFTLSYSATTDSPSAFALWVALSGPCTGTVQNASNVTASSSEYNVHIDYASDDPCNYTIGMAGQHPLADPCQAGTPGSPLSVFSIVMGRLDPCTAAPLSGDLVTVAVDMPEGCTLNVGLAADNLRGGVVGAAYGSVTMVDGTVTQGAPSGCAIGCWDFTSQCYGDTDGDDDVDTVDWPVFRDAFGTNYATGWNGGAGPYNPCGDFDHDGDVDTVDWPSFRDNFGSGDVPNDCPMACTWPPL